MKKFFVILIFDQNFCLRPDAFVFKCFHDSLYCKNHCCTPHIDFVLDFKDGTDVVVDNDGTIKSGRMYAVSCDSCENFTLDNSGVLEATSDTVFARELTGTNNITNSGTIKNTSARG